MQSNKRFPQIFIQESRRYGSLHPDVSKAIMKKFRISDGFVVATRGSEGSEWKVVLRHYSFGRKTLGMLDEILEQL